MVGISANIKLPLSYYPNDGGQWTVEVIDAYTDKKTKAVSVVCAMIDGPIRSEVGARATLSVSRPKHGTDYSLRRALREVFPTARTPSDVYKLQANFARIYGAWTNTRSTVAAQRDTKWKPTEIYKQSLAFSALVALQTLTWSVLSAAVQGMHSPLSPQPTSQRDARMRPDADRWLKAEEIEMATCFDKGTFAIVDLPPGVVELPSMFQYKLKTGPN
eukprot:3933900-Rhodomonas_salina.1